MNFIESFISVTVAVSCVWEVAAAAAAFFAKSCEVAMLALAIASFSSITSLNMSLNFSSDTVLSWNVVWICVRSFAYPVLEKYLN